MLTENRRRKPAAFFRANPAASIALSDCLTFAHGRASNREMDGLGSGQYDRGSIPAPERGAWMATLESGFVATTVYDQLGLLEPGDADLLQHSLALISEMSLTRDVGGFVQVSSILSGGRS